MDDYWGTANTGADKETVPVEPQQVAPATAAATAGDDDVDMIE